MAATTRRKWSIESLEKAIDEVRKGNLSVRAAASKYDVPKSTVYDNLTRQEPKSTPGPAPILNKTEEQELVTWITEMSAIGYGQTRQQVCLTVKKIFDCDPRPNPFAREGLVACFP